MPVPNNQASGEPTQAELEQLFKTGTPMAPADDPSQAELAAAFQAGEPVEPTGPDPLQVSHQAPPTGSRPSGRGTGAITTAEMQDLLFDQRATEYTGPLTTASSDLPLATAHQPMSGDDVDQAMLARYTKWSMAKEQKNPELQGRVLRVAAALRERPHLPQPDFFYIRDHIDEYERELAGEDWAELAKRHPRLAEFGLDPKVQPLLVDDSASLTGLSAALGGWEAAPDPAAGRAGGYDPSSLADVLGLPRLRTAPAWAKYGRDAAKNITRMLVQAQRAAGFAMPEIVADEKASGGWRVTTFPEAEARRDALIEQLRTVPTAYASSPFGRYFGELFSMAPLIAGDTGSRVGGAAVGAYIGAMTGPAAPVMVPLLAGAGAWAGSWAFNTATAVGPLQEEIARLDDGTGRPLGMERARPIAWAAAEVEGAVMATVFGRAMRGAPGLGPELQRREGEQ